MTKRVAPEFRRGVRYVQGIACERRKMFEALMEAVKTHAQGQIRHALHDVGDGYRTL